MDLGPHAAFIWASYGAVTLVVGALIAWLIADGRRQQRLLAQIEAETGRRRGDTA
jgi:heme exporter protein D